MSQESYSTPEVVGRNLTRLLDARHMPQAELARRLDVDPSTVHQYTKGKINIGVKTLTRIAAILGCEVVDLLADEVAA